MPADYDDGPSRKIAPLPDLDFATNTWSFEERAATLRWYELSHGTGDTRFAQFAPWMIDNNPGGYKRYRALIPALGEQVSHAIFFVHTYAVTANADGCMYELITARQVGFSKRQILDVLNFAFLSGGPRSINAVSSAAGPWLDSWVDDDPTGRVVFPSAWAVDPEAFRSGLDPTTTSVSEADRAAIRQWHERVNGEVPRFVDLWLRLRGPSYKANRARLEQATSSPVLPKQLFPLLALHLAAYQGRPEAVMFALEQAQWVGGIAQSELVGVIDTAFVEGNEWKMAVVLTDEVIETIEQWELAVNP
jgi:hypothetical protein